MTRRDSESRTLGGIGTMLLQSEACPACGKVHTSRLIRYLPAVARTLPGARSGMPFLHEASSTSGSGLDPRARRTSGLSIPWTIPRYTEESR